ncbi:MAG: HD domain-containing protein [Candidatus Dependentiae bacterium]
MKFNKNIKIIQKDLELIYAKYPKLTPILNAIDAAGGTAYFVGGMVRDLLLQRPVKDVDIEIHGLSSKQVEQVLQQFGVVDLVGKSFGVFKLYGVDVDWSLPRTDSSGRKPVVEVDPHMSIEQAFARRDLTINALGINAKTGELVDPFNGLQDVQNNILRSPNISFFAQDPLRFFRVMQFIARFEMQPDEELNALCKKMDISKVSRERIEQEFNKMLLRSKRPSLGIRWLKDIGRLQEILPELYATISVQQKQPYHPEGDVFEHSMQALDAAARIACNTEYEKLILLYAAMCHDLGKSKVSKIVDGNICSHGHAQVGAPLANKMLKRIACNKTLIDTVVKLVKLHMEPLGFIKSNAKKPAYKRLARKLSPDANIALLAKLFLADKQGRNPKSSMPLECEFDEVNTFTQKAEQAHVLSLPELPLLTGKDFLDVIKPCPDLGKVVKKAYELQLDGITDKDVLKKETLSFFDFNK